jgi:DNA adenine methylase
MTKVARPSPPIKRHGGKAPLAKRIIALMPPRALNPNAPAADDPGWVHFVEPFCGGAAVTLALLAEDPEGISILINDLDAALMDFWDTLRSREHAPELIRLANMTPLSRVEFGRARQGTRDLSAPERALAFLVRCRQSRQALGKDFVAPVRNRTRRGMQDQVSAWLSAVDGLPYWHGLLRRVLIENQPALKVIRSEDGLRTIFYIDCPYLHETRSARSAYGPLEMTDAQHAELLETLANVKGRFLLSGYHSPLYDRFALAHRWHCTEIETDNKAGGGATKRRMVECIWTNYEPLEAVNA